MRTSIIKWPSLTLGHPMAQPGWVRGGRARVGNLHVVEVPDNVTDAQVIVRLHATALFFTDLSKPDDFLVSWSSLDQGKILHTSGLPPRKSEDLADWIQEIVIGRAVHLGLTAYAIAQQTKGNVSEDQVKRYLERRASMSSFKLQHVFTALGLKISYNTTT